jgi:hypothetical protein
MKLWETYFRLWQRFSNCLTEVTTTQLQVREKSLLSDEHGERRTNYSYVLGRDVLLESGV